MDIIEHLVNKSIWTHCFFPLVYPKVYYMLAASGIDVYVGYINPNRKPYIYCRWDQSQERLGKVYFVNPAVHMKKDYYHTPVFSAFESTQYLAESHSFLKDIEW